MNGTKKVLGAALSLGMCLLGASLALAENKVTICHRPPGNPENVQTISVGESATTAHLKHGDELGECPAACGVCDDGNACTQDVCLASGECEYRPIDCDDGDPCTAEVCVDGACSHPPAADGIECNDENSCSTEDACSNGECLGTPVPSCCTEDADCASAQNRCQIGTCSGGTCSSQAKDCPPVDACTAAICNPNTGDCDPAPVDCSDSDVCTDDFCEVARDGCYSEPTTNPPQPSETSCDDGVDNDCDGVVDAADSDCFVCGDGVVQGDEQCDDGNTNPFDGCDQCITVDTTPD